MAKRRKGGDKGEMANRSKSNFMDTKKKKMSMRKRKLAEGKGY